MDSIDLIMKQYQGRTDDSMLVEGLSVIHNLPTQVSSSIREYLCYKAYLVMYSSEARACYGNKVWYLNIQLH